MACSKCRKRQPLYTVPSVLWQEQDDEPCFTVQFRTTLAVTTRYFHRVYHAGDVAVLPKSLVERLLRADTPYIHFLNEDDRERFYADVV
jgi:hypothetical protein